MRGAAQVGTCRISTVQTPASEQGRILLLLAGIVLLFAPAFARAQTRPTTTTGIELQAIERVTPAAAADDSGGVNWQRLTVAMAIVLGLIVALKYAAQWLFPTARVGAGGRGVTVLARTAIAPRQQVLLLKVGRRVLVVGESGGTLSALASIHEPDEVAELLGQIDATTPSASSRFKAMFGRAERDYEPEPNSAHLMTDEPDAVRTPAAETQANATNAIEPADPNITAAQNEINGLLDRMRSLTKSARR